MNNLGYTDPLYILAFDHRSTFYKKLYKVPASEITQEQHDEISEFKAIIFDGFKKALAKGIQKNEAAILTDEQYAANVLKEAKTLGTNVLFTLEKSGQKVFVLEYGDDFGKKLKEYDPTFAKVLIHYNPSDPKEIKDEQTQKLKKVSDFCHEHGIKFLLEVLVGATEEQLQEAGGTQELFDKHVRPRLTVELMKELHQADVEPDVWKMEGLESTEDYEQVVAAAREEGRDNVGFVILGRGATVEKVKEWFQKGANVQGVIGFAVGRTIFWDSLINYHDKKITKEEAAEQIGNIFFDLYQTFVKSKE